MSHQDRREPLPEGYQFGDARRPMHPGLVQIFAQAETVFGVTVSAAEKSMWNEELSHVPGWNVIEGEPFTEYTAPAATALWDRHDAAVKALGVAYDTNRDLGDEA